MSFIHECPLAAVPVAPIGSPLGGNRRYKIWRDRGLYSGEACVQTDTDIRQERSSAGDTEDGSIRGSSFQRTGVRDSATVH